MKRFSVAMQLTLIMFCIMNVPMVTIAWFCGVQILKDSEQSIAESSLIELKTERMINENTLFKLSENAVRLASIDSLVDVRNIKAFNELKGNYANASKSLDVMNELVHLNQSVEGVSSSFFYLNNSDYIISTDKGIIPLDKYENLDWIKKALVEQKGIRGVWHSRKLINGENVISHVLPLNQHAGGTQGLLVVNLKESQIEKNLHARNSTKQAYFLMRADGSIISHNNKSLLLQNGKEQPFVNEIMAQGAREGYKVYKHEGERLLYVWSRSNQDNWTNISVYSVDQLMNNAYSLFKKIIIITILITLAGTILTVLIATWLSRPIRELVRKVRQGADGVDNQNELVVLESAFSKMREDEAMLQKMLKEREKDSRRLAVYQLLKGEVIPQMKETFSKSRFLVAVVSLDHYRDYMSLTNAEARIEHGYLLTTRCEAFFSDNIINRFVYQGKGNYVMVVNFDEDELEHVANEIQAALIRVQQYAVEITGHSVTIGLSRQTDSSSNVPELVTEALEIIKQRIVIGYGNIFNWNDMDFENEKYMYPIYSERKILNYLSSGDIQSIQGELKIIREEICDTEHISYENILFIYHQLVGATINYLQESNINTARIVVKRGNLYASLATVETLEELEQHIRSFYEGIVEHMECSSREINQYGERIINFLNSHYDQDINYEDMAKAVGISYSYMRKIIYEMTGKSLIDYLNTIRIEKAKDLLLQTQMTITQIATAVGYYNVRSLNRFFQKFEGMTPSNFRQLR
jgi:AraC-like DNA-binding protein